MAEAGHPLARLCPRRRLAVDAAVRRTLDIHRGQRDVLSVRQRDSVVGGVLNGAAGRVIGIRAVAYDGEASASVGQYDSICSAIG